MKILLAVDGSKFSEAAARAVVRQFPSDSEIKVLNVVELTEVFDYPVPESATRKRQAQELVDRTAQMLRSAGLQADGTICAGDPRTAIIDFADSWHADLIVLGSHGSTALERFLLGNVSGAVVHHAHCSVEIVRPNGDEQP